MKTEKEIRDKLDEWEKKGLVTKIFLYSDRKLIMKTLKWVLD